MSVKISFVLFFSLKLSKYKSNQNYKLFKLLAENKYRDENHYMNSVRIFAEAAASLAGDDAQTSFYFAFVKHPGVPDTKCEEEIFKNAGASIKILDRTRYSTAIYTKASDITLSHHSTCSNLSVSVGVRSCYIAPIKIKYKWLLVLKLI